MSNKKELLWGSPISPIVANLYMEDFEKKAINSLPHTPWFWGRFVDDTFTIIKAAHKRNFLDHINSIDEHIQFTSEDSRPDGSMPFLDILIIPNEDGSLSTIVYRKHTHTDLYLQWDSHHTVSSKYSVVGTLHHRAETICSSPKLLQQERNIYRKHSRDVNTLHGLWTELRSSPKAQPKREEISLKLVITTTTRNHTWWYHIIEGWVRAWRKYAADIECKSI